MKILTEREKKILINHAKKQELRRLSSTYKCNFLGADNKQ